MYNTTPLEQAGIILYKGDFDADTVLGALAILHPEDFIKITGNSPEEASFNIIRDRNVIRLSDLSGIATINASECVIEVEVLLRLDRYIEAIKHVRRQTNLGLKEAKEFVCMVRGD